MTNTWHRLHGNPGKSGHLRVQVEHRGTAVQRLVLEAFVGPCPPGMQACHFPDRDPTNNRVENLRWGTPQDNMTDAAIHGTLCRGERVNTAKITEDTVRKIMAEPDRSWGWRTRLAGKYHVSIYIISRLFRGESWKHVTSQQTP